MSYYDYRIGVGSSLALGSLTNIEDLLWNYTRPLSIAPRTQPVNAWPIRTTLGSGRVRGDGTIVHEWEFSALKVAAVNYLLNTYLFSGGVVSTAVTIYTRTHDANTYARYNAYAVRPVVGEGIEYLRQGVFRLSIQFSDLVAL